MNGLRLLLAAWLLAVSSGCALVNPGVIEEIESNPTGDRAASTLVMTLDDGTRLPLKFVREDNLVHLGSGGRWWRRAGSCAAPVGRPAGRPAGAAGTLGRKRRVDAHVSL